MALLSCPLQDLHFVEFPMNVLIISTDFPPLLGGIATYTNCLARQMARQGHSVEVLAPGFAGWREWDAQPRPEGLRIVRSRWGLPLLREFRMWMLGRRCLASRPDAIFATAWFPAGYIAHLLHRRSGVEYYLAAHGSEFQDDAFNWRRRVKSGLRFLKRPVFGKARRTFAVSRFTAGLLHDQGVPQERIRVVPNGADPRHYRPHPDPCGLKRKHGVAGRTILLTVCRLDAHKGVHLVLEALDDLCRRFPDLLYAVVGRGPQEESLHRQAASLGLQEKVVWLGYLPSGEVLEWYQLCDLYVTLSHDIPDRTDLIEGFGICFVEAAACAKATLGCRSGGVADAVEDGKTGLLLDPRPSKKAVVEAISNLLFDEPLRRRLGEVGRQRVEQRLNWEVAAQTIVREFGAKPQRAQS